MEGSFSRTYQTVKCVDAKYTCFLLQYIQVSPILLNGGLLLSYLPNGEMRRPQIYVFSTAIYTGFEDLMQWRAPSLVLTKRLNASTPNIRLFYCNICRFHRSY